MDNFDYLIPITLFVCIAYAIKAVVDARVRKQLVASNVSQELISSIIKADETRRRHATLRWGAILIILTASDPTRQAKRQPRGCLFRSPGRTTVD